MGNAAKELFRKIADAVPKVLNDLKNALGELILAGAAKVGEFANDMIAAGENLVHGIVDGIGNAARSVIDAIGGVINDAIGWAKSLLGIASPSKVFRSIGGYVSEGFADGIAAKAGEAVGAMKALADDVVDAAKADLPAIEVPVGFNVRKLSAGSLGGFGFAAAFAAAPAGGQTTTTRSRRWTFRAILPQRRRRARFGTASAGR